MTDNIINQTITLAEIIQTLSEYETIVDAPILENLTIDMTMRDQTFAKKMDFFLTQDGHIRKNKRELVRGIIARHPKGWKQDIDKKQSYYPLLSMVAFEQFTKHRTTV